MKNNKNTVEMVNNKDFEVATNQLRKVYGDTWVDAIGGTYKWGTSTNGVFSVSRDESIEYNKKNNAMTITFDKSKYLELLAICSKSKFP